MQWHKTFNYEWLTGSIRKDLTPAGRGVWADILATAGLSRRQGYLERGHGVPYTIEELALWWNTPLDIVKRTFGACLEEGRLQLLSDGTYFVTNFEKYQSKKVIDKQSDLPNKIPLDNEHKELQNKVIAYKMGRKYPEDAQAGVEAREFDDKVRGKLASGTLVSFLAFQISNNNTDICEKLTKLFNTTPIDHFYAFIKALQLISTTDINTVILGDTKQGYDIINVRR